MNNQVKKRAGPAPDAHMGRDKTETILPASGCTISYKVKKLTTGALLCAVGVSCSMLYIPFGASKCFPAQAAVNVLCAMLLGPYYAVGCAFVISVLRNLLGLGTLLAFPGSMIGAFLAAVFYKRFRNYFSAIAGEVIGTGVLGALAAYPVAAYVLGKKAALLFYVMPFSISSAGGAVIAGLIIAVLYKTPVMRNIALAEEKKL